MTKAATGQSSKKRWEIRLRFACEGGVEKSRLSEEGANHSHHACETTHGTHSGARDHAKFSSCHSLTESATSLSLHHRLKFRNMGAADQGPGHQQELDQRTVAAEGSTHVHGQEPVAVENEATSTM